LHLQELSEVNSIAT